MCVCCFLMFTSVVYSSMKKTMAKELSIHLKYEKENVILTTRSKEFLTKAAAIFNIKEEEIEIYELSKTSKRKIGIENLRDFIRVELFKKEIKEEPVSMNGQRSVENDETSKTSIVAAMCLKLKENKLLTTTERELLYSHLQSLPPSLKRRLENGNPHPAEMKNRKIQVHPIDQKLAYTQTDKLIEFSKASTSTLDNVFKEIKRYAKKEKRDPLKTAELMTKSYNERRNFIMINKPMVQFVREKYPLLFTLTEVRNELDRIFYDGKCDEFIANVEKYAEIVLSMPNDDDPLLKTIREKEILYTTPIQKKYAVEVGSILMLSRLTGESRKYLKVQDTSIDPGNLPYIECEAKLNEIFFDQYTFNIYTENQLICKACDFKEAILCLMASFFIFNITYPDEAYNTLVIMEKLYLEGNDTENSEIEENIQQIIKTLDLKYKAKKRSK